ncbi:ribonuclease HII [Thermoflavimicrobium dichotomicum]|uniref:Ribonuclease HII n=1 Tax=Thermoflavimicrobium dichotomicum TaxID=46223 RepID=A0A1I3UES0_9BACL|nr:ribonuclease HII [Thermoflavimicrobium dichotomicum]SFJ80366.1 RNase HII [Thermoflavimicrobium dichotomicum]
MFKTMTIQQVKKWLSEQKEVSPEMLELLMADSRIGVRKLAQSYLREQERLQKERARLEAMWEYERAGWTQGYQVIAGVDEAGRGPLAGPVVAAAIVLPSDFDVTGLNDSKQLTREERNELRNRIERQAMAVGVGIVDVEYIDQYNILQATYEAMRRAIQKLSCQVDYLLVDAVKIPGISIPQQGIIKGDQLSHSIAAASIIAKTTRDEWMIQAAEKYPHYGFDKHMGYGTPEHLAALVKWGVSPIHRRSFAPVKEIMEQSRHADQVG